MNKLLETLEEAYNYSLSEQVGSINIVMLHRKLEEAIALVKELSEVYNKARLGL